MLSIFSRAFFIIFGSSSYSEAYSLNGLITLELTGLSAKIALVDWFFCGFMFENLTTFLSDFMLFLIPYDDIPLTDRSDYLNDFPCFLSSNETNSSLYGEKNDYWVSLYTLDRLSLTELFID